MYYGCCGFVAVWLRCCYAYLVFTLQCPSSQFTFIVLICTTFIYLLIVVICWLFVVVEWNCAGVYSLLYCCNCTCYSHLLFAKARVVVVVGVIYLYCSVIIGTLLLLRCAADQVRCGGAFTAPLPNNRVRVAIVAQMVVCYAVLKPILNDHFVHLFVQSACNNFIWAGTSRSFACCWVPEFTFCFIYHTHTFESLIVPLCRTRTRSIVDG